LVVVSMRRNVRYRKDVIFPFDYCKIFLSVQISEVM
jgi:hypothetical protein